MTKLKYPINGLYKETSPYIEDSTSFLQKALNTSSMSCPSNFAYRSYINNLPNTINGNVNGMKAIDDIISSISKEYEDLEVELTSKAKLIGDYKVNERERLIISD